jgi:hypothetical protein
VRAVEVLQERIEQLQQQQRHRPPAPP